MSSLLSDTKPQKEQQPDMSAAFALKSSLRRSMLRTLRGLDSSELERQSCDVFKILLDQPFFRQANSVGCYLSMAKGELQTDHIVKHLLRRRSALYTPYIPAPPNSSHNPEAPPASVPPAQEEMKMLRLYSSKDLENCPLDRWNIVDPGLYRRDEENCLREDVMNPRSPALDLILIPGVAFDEDCNRLGRGKAFYDRFLQTYTSTRPRPLLVALALKPQILAPEEKVPTTEMDFQLDGVVSPFGVTWRKKEEGR